MGLVEEASLEMNEEIRILGPILEITQIKINFDWKESLWCTWRFLWLENKIRGWIIITEGLQTVFAVIFFIRLCRCDWGGEAACLKSDYGDQGVMIMTSDSHSRAHPEPLTRERERRKEDFSVLKEEKNDAVRDRTNGYFWSLIHVLISE